MPKFLFVTIVWTNAQKARIEPNLNIFFYQNDLETPKVMTLTFDLENGNTFVPIMKLIRLLVSEEFGNTHTDTQRTYGYYSIDSFAYILPSVCTIAISSVCAIAILNSFFQRGGG